MYVQENVDVIFAMYGHIFLICPAPDPHDHLQIHAGWQDIRNAFINYALHLLMKEQMPFPPLPLLAMPPNHLGLAILVRLVLPRLENNWEGPESCTCVTVVTACKAIYPKHALIIWPWFCIEFLQDVAGLMVVNESQVRKAMVRPRNPLLQTELIVRYADVDKYEDIEKTVTGGLHNLPTSKT